MTDQQSPPPSGPAGNRLAPRDGLTIACTCERVLDGRTVDVRITRRLRIKLLTDRQRERGFAPGELVSVFVPSATEERISPVFESGYASGFLLPRSREEADVEGVAQPCPPLGICSPARVITRVNRALVDVEVSRMVRVRLLDCWAPDPWGKCPCALRIGQQSKEHLADLCPRGTALVLHVPTSSESVLTGGRVRGRLWREGERRDLSQRQRDAGQAWETHAEERDVIERVRQRSADPADTTEAA